MNCPSCKKRGHNVEVINSGNLYRCLRCLKDTTEKEFKDSLSLKGRGKVLLCTIHGRTVVPEADIQLLAVGKPKGRTYFQWWEHKPGLAPTRELVTFTKEHNRKGRLDGWFERYTESLLEEWEERGDFFSQFSELINWLTEGKTVAIACYCDHHKRPVCHLSILRGLIEDFGFTVEEAEPIEYK
jgi:hypothetical protein